LNVAPSLSYNSIHKPLKAPKGKRWNYDSLHKEWGLVAVDKPSSSTSIIIVDAVVITEGENGESGTNTNTATTATRIIDNDPELRRANDFTGENVRLAPNPLKIPRADIMTTSAVAVAVPKLTQTEVVGVLLRECRGKGMSRSEARAYLMLSDWDLTAAIENAHEDGF